MAKEPVLFRKDFAVKISAAQMVELAKLLAVTHETEADCNDCLREVAEYAERVLAEESLAYALRRVEQHLLICMACKQEYMALISLIDKNLLPPGRKIGLAS